MCTINLFVKVRHATVYTADHWFLDTGKLPFLTTFGGTHGMEDAIFAVMHTGASAVSTNDITDINV